MGGVPHFRRVRGRLPLPSFLFFYFLFLRAAYFPCLYVFEYVVSEVVIPASAVNQLVVCRFFDIVIPITVNTPVCLGVIPVCFDALISVSALFFVVCQIFLLKLLVFGFKFLSLRRGCE